MPAVFSSSRNCVRRKKVLLKLTGDFQGNLRRFFLGDDEHPQGGVKREGEFLRVLFCKAAMADVRKAEFFTVVGKSSGDSVQLLRFDYRLDMMTQTTNRRQGI